MENCWTFFYNFSKRAKAGQEAGTNKKGYVAITLNYKQYLCHRIIFWMFHGYMPSSIDHINGDGTDNRIENIRPCTRSQNSANRSSWSNTGYKGVKKNNKKYAAQIIVNKKYLHLGTYATPEEAAKVYDKAALQYFGEFARINYYT
jgi:hypothetical protein